LVKVAMNSNDKLDPLLVIGGLLVVASVVLILVGVWWWAIAGMSKDVGMAIGVTVFVMWFLAIALGALENLQ
jgi:hypothetical protein